MKRMITKRQEQVYRMRHHEFAGLSTKQVATILGITSRSVTRHLRNMQKIAPQLFPILTKRQANIHNLFVNIGLEQKAIAKILNIDKNIVATSIHRLRQKGLYIPRRLHHTLYMPKAHDHQIKQKF